MKGARARGSITSRSGYMIELGLPSGEHSHFRPNRVAIAFGTLQGKLQPVVAVRAIVHPDFRWRAQRRHHQVEFAIVIEVSKRRTATPSRRLSGESRVLGQRGPFAFGVVPKNCVWLVDLPAASHRGRLNVTSADENVFPAVVVKVRDIRAISHHRIAQQSHTAPGGDFGKPTLAVVLV